MPGKAAKVVITERQQVILQQLSRSTTVAFRLRQRARVILLAFDGRLNQEIESIVELRVCERFLSQLDSSRKSLAMAMPKR